jgi:hypothetical protein
MIGLPMREAFPEIAGQQHADVEQDNLGTLNLTPATPTPSMTSPNR